MILKYTKQLPQNKRIKIVEAVQLICSRYEAGEVHTSIKIPPRYGKSSVIRLAAMEINAETKLPCVMTAPWSDNVDQIKEVELIKDMYERYGVPKEVVFSSHRCRALKTNTWWKTEAGIPTLLTCTISLINHSANQQQFLDGIEDMYQRFKKRVPVFVDEAHTVKDTQEWGKFIRKIIDVGGYVILLTGTPVPGIPGFQEIASDWANITRHIPRKQIIDGELKDFLETYEGPQRSIKDITADINVSWGEAWDIGALARVNAAWIDIEVVDKATGDPLGPLSKLPKSELNGRLRSIEESEEMICKKTTVAVDRFLQLRAKEKTNKAQMLVVTGSDWERNGSNVHAVAYEEAIIDALFEQGYDADDFRIEIATGVKRDGDLDKESTRRIKDFRKGQIDILIVKLMGIVGLDVPACKILVFGSTLRKGPMAAQALSRVLTTWYCRADMVLSMDVSMVELYKSVVGDQGGEATESNLHLVHVQEISPPPEKPLWGFQEAKVHSYGDEKGGATIGDFETELRIIKAKYHTNGLSDRQIIENFQNGGFPFSDDDRQRDERVREEEASYAIKDLDEGLGNTVGEFGKEAKSIVSRYIDYPKDGARYREKIKELQARAKELCNVPKYIKVQNIDDAVLLRRLIGALPHAERLVFVNEQTRRVI